MKIKQPSRKNLLKAKLEARSYHWWLVPETPRKAGRLSQLNKQNKRTPSEFVRLAEKLENVPTKNLFR